MEIEIDENIDMKRMIKLKSDRFGMEMFFKSLEKPLVIRS